MLSFPSGRTAEELVVDNAAGLAWVVNLGCIELHPHLVRSGDLENPDELRVDLDPGPGVTWACMDGRRQAAHEQCEQLMGRTSSSWSYVQSLGGLSKRQLRNCAVCRKRLLCM
jgi:DNA primase